MSLLDLPLTHRRSVALTLRLLEERITEVERWIQEPAEHSPLRLVARDLDAGRIPDLLARIRELRALVIATVEPLGIPPERVSIHRRCEATLGLTWELCPDLRPERMGGYGAVPEAATTAMTELATTLEAKVLALESALGPRIHDPSLPTDERHNP